MSKDLTGNTGYALSFDLTGYTGFKGRLKLRREKIGLSQSELARKIGVTKSTIQNYEYGKSPKGDNIIKIAQVLKCKIAWLLNGESPENEEPILPEKRILGGKQGIAHREAEKFATSNSSNLTKIIIEHQGMIKQFKDPEKAKEFNECLIEIETEDPEGYDELFKEAKAISKTIKRLRNRQTFKKKSNKDDNNLQGKRSS